MIVSRLLLRNFMSHENTELFFDAQLYSIHGRNFDKPSPDASNGSGKSSILYGIIWALTGTLPQGCDKNDVIKFNASGCHVELDLLGKDSLQIVRSKQLEGGEKLSATYNKQSLGEELKVVQPRLNALYGISWDTFCNTVFLGPQSKSAQFVRATPGERAKLLAELIDDSVFQEAGLQVAAEMSLLKQEQDRALFAVSQLELSQQQVTATLQRLSQSYADEQHQQRLKEAQAAQQAHQLEVQILQLTEKLKTSPQISPIEIHARINTLNESNDRLRALAAGVRFKIDVQAPKIGDTCITCGQPFSTHAASNLTQTKAALQQELRTYQEDLRGLEEVQRNLQRQLLEVQQWSQTKASYERGIDQAKQQIYLLKQGLENRTLVMLHAEQRAVQGQLKDIREMMLEKQTVIANNNLRLPILKVLHVGFKQEIRNMLLDDVRSVLQFHSSQFVSALSGDEFTVEFPPTSATGREKFEIEIKSGGKRNKLTSGGETYRAQLAILLALALAMKHQQKSPFQFLMIDEALSFVDPEGARAFAKLMGALQPHFSQIFLTSPIELEEMPGTLIRVERRNRCSTVAKG